GESEGSNAEIVERLGREFGGNAKAKEGIRRLEELVAMAVAAGVSEERLHLDLAIARGLDYYTGTVYETFLTDLPAIGSICSGGRYDNLASLYTKQVLPGVGASLGLDRLMAAMEELHMLQPVATPAPALVGQCTADRLGDYQQMGRVLRAAGIGVEVYPEARKIGQQLQYAEKRGHRVALIAGPDEFARGVWKIKDLALREETTVTSTEVVAAIHRVLANKARGPAASGRGVEEIWTAVAIMKPPSRRTSSGTGSVTWRWTRRAVRCSAKRGSRALTSSCTGHVAPGCWWT